MTQCELWADTADVEWDEHKIVRYSFDSEQKMNMVAEENVPYGKKD